MTCQREESDGESSCAGCGYLACQCQDGPDAPSLRGLGDGALLDVALRALHDIGGAYQARTLAARPHLTAPLRASMEAKALTDAQIEARALDTWEQIALAVAARAARAR